jgi:hypothetical protein
MCPLNIFINRMFKSFTAALLFLFVESWAALPARVWQSPGSSAGPPVPAFARQESGRDSVQTGTGTEHPGIRKQLESPTYNRMLDKAIRYQEKADSLGRISIAWRKQAAEMIDPVLRGRLQGRIEKLEDSVGMYSMLADEHFNYLLNSLPEEGGAVTRHPYLVRDTVLNGITVYRYDLTDEFRTKLDSIRAEGGPETKAQKADARKEASPAGGPVPKSAPSSGFKVLDASPYGPGNPIERDFRIPPGVFYRIQLAVYSQAIEPGHFGGLSPIMAEAIPGKNLTRYYVGKFTRLDEARAALNRVRSIGYRDAFIIGYYNGKKGSLSKLRSLEE